MDLQALRAHMDVLAGTTRHLVEEGDRRGLRFREDSLSDRNLLDLDVANHGVTVHRFTQSAEKHVGANWEWWVGSDITGWICLRIQAKRSDGDAYRQLDHPGERADEFQYDTLIRTSAAAHHPTFPYYVFFTGYPAGWPNGARWSACPAGVLPPRCRHYGLDEYGCAVVPARVVAGIHATRGPRRKLIEEHLSFALPWSTLFDFSPFAKPRARALSNLRDVMADLIDFHAALSGDVDTAAPWYPYEVVGEARTPGYERPRPGERLPDYVQFVRLPERVQVQRALGGQFAEDAPDAHVVAVFDLGFGADDADF